MPFINIKVSPIALSIYLASLTTLCYNINSLNLTTHIEVERSNTHRNSHPYIIREYRRKLVNISNICWSLLT